MNVRIETSGKRNVVPVSMSRKAVAGALASALILWSLTASAALAAPIPLLVSQALGFAYLGHSCGGIQEHSYATGFDPASGYPTGDVYLSTRCGGSGRGGGGSVTTYSAWIAVTWDFAGNVLSSSKLTIPPTVNPNFSATDANGDQVYNSINFGGRAYLVVPVPAAPTGVTAVQSGDQFQVTWTPSVANPAVILSSTLTATPVNSTAPVLTTTVTGSAASGVVAPLQPSTTYQVTVVTTTAGGSSPPSTPYTVTTEAASIAPSAPTGVSARWEGNPDTSTSFQVSWNAAVPGDAPVDQYEITITGSDGGGTFTQDVPGTALTAYFTADPTPNWTITVRAHNAAGWSPWSASFTLGGL
jgi:hypothetical protein